MQQRRTTQQKFIKFFKVTNKINQTLEKPHLSNTIKKKEYVTTNKAEI